MRERQRVTIRHGDCLEVLPTLETDSIDACVTDPPYHLTSIVKRFGADNAALAKSNGATGVYGRASAGFMGQKWDGGDVAFRPETWASVLRVLKPGAHLVAFGAPRNYHRMACAIEDAGFEIRDSLMWLFGSGFPKSHDISKAIDRAAGAAREVVGEYPAHSWASANVEHGAQNRTKFQFEKYSDEPATDAARQWSGWGTALKPAYEPIILARKPFKGTVADNVMAHGVGALNIDGCRVEGGPSIDVSIVQRRKTDSAEGWRRPWMNNQSEVERRQAAAIERANSLGRWPANIIHDGSEEVLAGFPESESQPGGNRGKAQIWGGAHGEQERNGFADSGSAARFFYTSKAGASDRLGSKHPTVKPVDLIAYLCRLITPPGGLILDPFAGSGTTGMACMREGFRAILIEREAQYVADIKRRLAHVKGEDAPLFIGIQAESAPPRKGRQIYGVFADEKSGRRD